MAVSMACCFSRSREYNAANLDWFWCYRKEAKHMVQSFLIDIFIANVMRNRKGTKVYWRKKDAAQDEVMGD